MSYKRSRKSFHSKKVRSNKSQFTYAIRHRLTGKTKIGLTKDPIKVLKKHHDFMLLDLQLGEKVGELHRLWCFSSHEALGVKGWRMIEPNIYTVVLADPFEVKFTTYPLTALKRHGRKILAIMAGNLRAKDRDDKILDPHGQTWDQHQFELLPNIKEGNEVSVLHDPRTLTMDKVVNRIIEGKRPQEEDQ